MGDKRDTSFFLVLCSLHLVSRCAGHSSGSPDVVLLPPAAQKEETHTGSTVAHTSLFIWSSIFFSIFSLLLIVINLMMENLFIAITNSIKRIF